MLYAHYSEYTGTWRWPNFSIAKLSCPCCGEYYHDPAALDKLQRARELAGVPFVINSGHRCIIHNANVGGRPSSMHKLQIAFDVSIRGRDKDLILSALKQAGFTTFGYYLSFIHTDVRPNRRWYSSKQARALWTAS